MIVNVFVANKKLRTDDLDGAIELLRATLEDEYATTDMLRCGATTAALVQALLRRGGLTDLREAQAAIDRLSAVPTEPGFVVYDLWLLPMRAAQARARGDELRTTTIASRYRAMAKTLGFQGHICMGRGDAMTAAAPSGVVTFLFTDVEGSTVGGRPTPMGCGRRWPSMTRCCAG